MTRKIIIILLFVGILYNKVANDYYEACIEIMSFNKQDVTDYPLQLIENNFKSEIILDKKEEKYIMKNKYVPFLFDKYLIESTKQGKIIIQKLDE